MGTNTIRRRGRSKSSSLFQHDQPVRLNARVAMVANDSFGNMGYSHGYRVAAERLYLSANRKLDGRDELAFPIVFLWRHYVELMLKEIARLGLYQSGDVLTERQKKTLTNHDLGQIWKLSAPFVNRALRLKKSQLAQIEARIVELHTADPGSFTFRYATTKNGKPSLPKRMKFINLRTLHRNIRPIANDLDSALSELMEWNA
jgi:hypothetical protein